MYFIAFLGGLYKCHNQSVNQSINQSIRLEELRQRRTNTKLHQQIKYLEEIIRSHEANIADLETDNIRLLKVRAELRFKLVSFSN
jgi:hypothetical protein